MIGSQIFRVESVGSTNTLAAEIGVDPNSHGSIVIADEQTAGRGQYGRSWLSRPGDSLLMSVVVHPPVELRRPVILVAWAAVALGDAILSLTGIQARIKWPNDLLIRGKKVSGILTEATNAAVVLGMGLNLNQTMEDFERAGLPDATSLKLAADKPFDRDEVLAVVVSHLDREWNRLLVGEFVPVEADWKWRIGLLGRPVIAERHDGTSVSGRLMDMSFVGIEIATDHGAIEVLTPETVKQLRGL